MIMRIHIYIMKQDNMKMKLQLCSNDMQWYVQWMQMPTYPNSHVLTYQILGISIQPIQPC
jgi:hypothetical protein